jgi:hypothetical protein
MMRAGLPHAADERELGELLGSVESVEDQARRLDTLGARLLGRPYLKSPLVGSAQEPERLVSRLDGFDCVTFVETVLALAVSRAPIHFEPALKALRYRRAQLAWEHRNHYMSQWLERNQAAGTLVRVMAHRWVEEGRPRELTALPDFPAQKRRLAYLPLERLDELAATARHGDLVCFVSERPELDCFHAGLLVAGESLGLRHASRSAGQVVEEPLASFLERNETPGLMLARLLPVWLEA